MVSNAIIALIVSGGAAIWVYIQAARGASGDLKSAVIAAAISGGLLFIVVMMILSALF